jgi:peptidoglycan/xylan/chitin deacetylase (PgdA/CDA1 family)
VHDYRRLAELEALLAQRAEHSVPRDNEFLDWDTLRTLTRAGIFDFAPHTVWHPVLSTAADYADEIVRSHARLRDELGITSTLFAYPYGRPQHYSTRVQDVLKTLHVESAFTTVYGHLEPRSPPLALPRINVGRRDSLAKFAMRLRRPWLFEWGYKWREFKYRSRP